MPSTRIPATLSRSRTCQVSTLLARPGCDSSQPGLFFPLPFPSMSTVLSPEERDEFLAQLRRRTATPGFHFLSTEHLQELNEIESDGAPILSLFMELTPEMRVGDSWQITFKDLSKQALQKADEMGKKQGNPGGTGTDRRRLPRRPPAHRPRPRGLRLRTAWA